MTISKQRQAEYAKAEMLYKLVALETEVLGIELISYVEPTFSSYLAFLEKHTMKGVRLKIKHLESIERMLSAQL